MLIYLLFGWHQETNKDERSKLEDEFKDYQLVIIIDFGGCYSKKHVVNECANYTFKTELRQKDNLVRQGYHRCFYSRIRDRGHNYEGWQQVEDDVQSTDCVSEEVKDGVAFWAHA